MINVSVFGRPKRFSKKLIKEITEFVAAELMTSRLHESLDLSVIFLDINKGSKRGDTVFGDMYPCYDDDDNPYYPKQFEVRIDNKLSAKAMLTTLCHEMVHVKQHAKGEIYQYSKQPHLTRWRGETFDTSPELSCFFSPWEIEANGYEVGLMYLIRKEILVGKKKNV